MFPQEILMEIQTNYQPKSENYCPNKTAHNNGFCASAALSCSNQHQQHSGICSGGTNIAGHQFLLFIFIKSQAAVTGGRNSNATPAKSPNDMGKFKNRHSRQKKNCQSLTQIVLKMFCKINKQKGGDQRPLEKRGDTEKPYEQE